jgi:1,4-alpha-glucan branching enzyme
MMRDSRDRESYRPSRSFVCFDPVTGLFRVGPCVLLVVLMLALLSGGVALGQQAKTRDFSKEAARSAPAWARDGVIYEIFPRTFSASGDFKGVTARLDELKTLGVNVLWLMPIHPLGQEKKKGSIGSPYAVRDYYAINPDYGTKEDLRSLVSEAHRRGMKVIIDIVANHTSWDSVLMKEPDFYTRDASG